MGRAEHMSGEQEKKSKSERSRGFIRAGKVVIILNGRFAGRKGIVVKPFEESNDRSYGHCLVAGIDRYPLKVTKDMKDKRFKKRSKVKPFLKVFNYNHLMPTRYSFSDVDLKDAQKITVGDSYTNANLRQEAKKAIKKQLEERYLTGKNTWFFKKLRF